MEQHCSLYSFQTITTWRKVNITCIIYSVFVMWLLHRYIIYLTMWHCVMATWMKTKWSSSIVFYLHSFQIVTTWNKLNITCTIYSVFEIWLLHRYNNYLKQSEHYMHNLLCVLCDYLTMWHCVSFFFFFFFFFIFFFFFSEKIIDWNNKFGSVNSSHQHGWYFKWWNLDCKSISFNTVKLLQIKLSKFKYYSWL